MTKASPRSNRRPAPPIIFREYPPPPTHFPCGRNCAPGRRTPRSFRIGRHRIMHFMRLFGSAALVVAAAAPLCALPPAADAHEIVLLVGRSAAGQIKIDADL